METLDKLPGEGVTVTVTKTRYRVACDVCGEDAHFRHTYLLPNARTNPQSSGYRRDDVSWCSDFEQYTCRDCKRPGADGYGWCGTFPANETFAHMFLKWRETKFESED